MNKTLEWGEDKEDELKKILDKFEKKTGSADSKNRAHLIASSRNCDHS